MLLPGRRRKITFSLSPPPLSPPLVFYRELRSCGRSGRPICWDVVRRGLALSKHCQLKLTLRNHLAVTAFCVSTKEAKWVSSPAVEREAAPPLGGLSSLASDDQIDLQVTRPNDVLQQLWRLFSCIDTFRSALKCRIMQKHQFKVRFLVSTCSGFSSLPFSCIVRNLGLWWIRILPF